jgi:hypothetical protein
MPPSGYSVVTTSRISDFRRVHPYALVALFVPVLRPCQKAGLVSFGHVALV